MRQFLRCAYISLGTLFAFGATAQQVVSIPTHVEVTEDGVFRIVTTAIPPTQIEELVAGLPVKIPVFTVLDGEVIAQGVNFTHHGNEPATDLTHTFPGPVVLSEDGTWYVWPLYWSRTCAPVMPGETVRMPGSDFSHLAIEDPSSPLGLRSLQPLAPAEGPTLVVDYDNEFAPQPDTTVEAGIARGVAVWTEYLKNESFTAELRMYWNPNLIGTSTIAFNERVYAEFNWTQIYGLLTVVEHPSSDQDPVENFVHQFIPIGAEIPITNGTDFDDIEPIQIDGMLLSKYGFSFTPAVVIGFNPTFIFDFDATDGIASNAFDFAGTLVHEIGHAAGFQSEQQGYGMPPPAPLPQSIALLDVFRFGPDETRISATEMSSADRWFGLSGEPAVGIDINNENRVYDMTGPSDGFGPQHWRGFEISSDDYIGIMNPFGNFGPRNKGGSYLQDAEKQVFDMIGFDVDDGALLTAVPPIDLQDPAVAATIDSTASANLVWSSASGATAYHVFVYDLDLGPEPVEVFAMRDIPAGTFTATVPAQTLLSNHAHEWFVSGENAGGLAYSDTRGFTTEFVCLADVNMDGVLNGADFTAWINAFNNNLPECDQNSDGNCDPADFTAWVANFNAGCP